MQQLETIRAVTVLRRTHGTLRKQRRLEARLGKLLKLYLAFWRVFPGLYIRGTYSGEAPATESLDPRLTLVTDSVLQATLAEIIETPLSLLH